MRKILFRMPKNKNPSVLHTQNLQTVTKNPLWTYTSQPHFTTMRKFLILLIGLLSFSSLFVYSNNSISLNTTPVARKVLAIQLMPNWEGAITFGIATEQNGQIVALKHVSQRQFILIGSGKMKHVANPSQRNFFAENGIPNCDVVYDETRRIHEFECDPVANLWKLRLKTDRNDPTIPGWAHKLSTPDEGQMALLRNFGITRLNDFIFDQDVFNLLKAVNDPAWVAQYN